MTRSIRIATSLVGLAIVVWAVPGLVVAQDGQDGDGGERSRTPSLTPTQLTASRTPTVQIITRTATETASVPLPRDFPRSPELLIAESLHQSLGLPTSAAERAVGALCAAGLAFGLATPYGAPRAPVAVAIAAAGECRFAPSVVEATWYTSLASSDNGEVFEEHPDATQARALLGPALVPPIAVTMLHLCNVVAHHAVPQWRLSREIGALAAQMVTGYLLPTAARHAMTLVVHGTSGGIVGAGLLCLAWCTLVPVAIAVFLFRYAAQPAAIPRVTTVTSTHEEHPVKEVATAASSGGGQRPVASSPAASAWLSLPTVNERTFVLIPYISHARVLWAPGCRLFVVVEQIAAIAVGALGGIRPGARSCTLVAIAQLAVTLLCCLAAFIISPNRRRLDDVAFAVLSVCQIAVCAGAIALGVTDGESTAPLAVGIAALLVAMLGGSVAAMAVALYQFYDARRRLRLKQRRRRERNRALGLPDEFDVVRQREHMELLATLRHGRRSASPGRRSSGDDDGDDDKAKTAQQYGAPREQRHSPLHKGIQVIEEAHVAYGEAAATPSRAVRIDDVGDAATPPPRRRRDPARGGGRGDRGVSAPSSGGDRIGGIDWSQRTESARRQRLAARLGPPTSSSSGNDSSDAEDVERQKALAKAHAQNLAMLERNWQSPDRARFIVADDDVASVASSDGGGGEGGQHRQLDPRSLMVLAAMTPALRARFFDCTGVSAAPVGGGAEIRPPAPPPGRPRHTKHIREQKRSVSSSASGESSASSEDGRFDRRRVGRASPFSGTSPDRPRRQTRHGLEDDPDL